MFPDIAPIATIDLIETSLISSAQREREA